MRSLTRITTRLPRFAIFTLALRLVIASGADASGPADVKPTPFANPNKEVARYLAQRTIDQKVAAKTLASFHDFQFSDQREKSGITFQHHVVDDAGKNWRPAHYDHGNGIAIADVDGDGRLDIYFVNQLGGNQLWRNLGGGKFEDITAQAGVGLEDRICVAAAFADLDNDGIPDLFVTTVRHGNVLFKGLGGGKFKDISHEAGVDYVGHSSGIVLFDFNNDGLLDIFVCNVGVYTSNEQGLGGFYRALPDAFLGHTKPERSENCILYQNLGGGKFRDVTKEMGLEGTGWNGDASFCDVNNDGFPDLYILNMQGENHYFENQGGKKFIDKTSVTFGKTPWGAMGIKFFDFNNDGLIDLFVTDMHSDMTDAQTQAGKTELNPVFEKRKSDAWCAPLLVDGYLKGATNSIFGNAFYLNKGNGVFGEVSDQIGAETYWPWGISVGDLNADGFEDVFVTAGMGYPFRYGFNSVLLNDQGRRFFDSECLLGVEPRKNGRLDKSYFRLDASGADRDHPLAQGKSGVLPVVGSISTRSAAIFDLDDDGDLDIVTAEMNDRPQVLINNLSDKKAIHFLKVALVGTASNRDGLGATVRLTAGGKTYTRYNDGKSGYLSQSTMPLYFGLADATKVDRIEVTWPSGKRQTLTQNLPVNTRLVITEGQ